MKGITALSFTITDEHTHDSKYIYNMFGHNAVIPPKKNASTQSRGSSERAKIVRFIKKNSMELWKENNDYGKRWIVEIYFSGLKRVMSEVIKAKKIESIVQELVLMLLITIL